MAFDVSVTLDADDSSAGGSFTLGVAGQTLRGAVEPGKEHTLPLGKMHLKPGSHTIAIIPARIAGAELMRLRTVTLTPSG
jgi:hypothetical protein